jgi:hypothetical protein
MRLNLEPNIASPDDFYQELIDLHRDLTDGESALVAVLRAAMTAAREDIVGSAEAATRAPGSPA